MATAADPHVTGVDFVCIPTADIERAVAFYGDVLGLPERKRWGSMPAVEFQAGHLTLVPWDPRAFGLELRSGTSPIALRVDDVASARAALEERGVAFRGETIDSGVCLQAIFADPDGNALILHHRYAPEA